MRSWTDEPYLLICFSSIQIASVTGLFFHLTKYWVYCLLRVLFIFVSRIFSNWGGAGLGTCCRSSVTESSCTACVSEPLYCVRSQTLNMGEIPMFVGNWILYALCPYFSRIWQGPTFLGSNFVFFVWGNLSFFRYAHTKSPTLNCTSLLFWSATSLYFWFEFCRWTLTWS